MTVRLLITGATGLLGACFMREAPVDKSSHGVLWTPLGVSRTHERANCLKIDITSRRAWLDIVHQQRITHIVNCAAIRNPDECRNDPIVAYAANAGLPAVLAEVAIMSGAKLVQISTDYVFSGEHPPYREDSVPDPINVYGRTKLAGEQAILAAADSLVVRIPALFRCDLDDERNVAHLLANRLREGKRFVMDAQTVRYYTSADDVARAVCHAIGLGYTGILHVTSLQKTTKAGMARAVARRLGVPDTLVEDGPVEATMERRPHDSHLDASRYATLGGPVLRGVLDCLPI